MEGRAMSDYTLDTTQRAPGAIIIDGHRYLRAGITRSVQRAVNQRRRRITELEAEAATAEETNDTDKFDAVEDEVAEQILDILGVMLVSDNGAEPAGVYLKRAWAEDRLQLDTHLYPLMTHLFGEMQQPVPPA
jgi:hypothetical protein